MFDIGFIEMLVVAIIALLVLGPERLPGAVRTVGLTIGRIKRGFSEVREQVEREIGADELRQQLHNERIMAELEKQALGKSSNVKRNGNQNVTTDAQTDTPDQPSAAPDHDSPAPPDEQR